MEDPEKEIAVVGIGCSFPGGEGLDNFWKVLLEGKTCTVQIPEERFDCGYWYDPDDSKPGKTYTSKAALINGLNDFDNKFFGITDEEAAEMDPQQKLLLECTYRALENAGIPFEKASGTKTGVFLGMMNRDYELIHVRYNPRTISHSSGTGTAMSIAANRISYTFNFSGPSLVLDCACSSSLVALHLACQAIRQGDCEMAVCGGVSCILEPRLFVALSKAKMLSPEGISKPFSSRADGYGRGEGCGIVLVKPLKKALQDADHVWGIIRSTAVNQDGRSVTPITRPSMVQQEELLRSIYATHVDPSHVQYVEAHGTGTPAGDPTEASSISKVIAKARTPGSKMLRMGSVKGNIGHTESAAGVAGLIKVLLMMHHETIVPSLFYSEDSASIDAKGLCVKVPTTVEKWEKSGPFGRVAGINNFGFGGTNSHAVVSQYTQTDVSKSNTGESQAMFVLSAMTEKSLTMMIEDTAKIIRMGTSVSLQNLVYTSACKRSHSKHRYRKAFHASTLSKLEAQLTSALNKKITPSRLDPRLIFVFCGNGLTYKGMCKQLLREELVFREKVKEIDGLFQKYGGKSILQKLEDTSDNDSLSKPDVAQPMLFAIQVSIDSLLKHWGIKPDAIVGHSVGEVAAAHCSGLLSLEDAVKVIYFRSTLQSKATGGKMLVVSNMEVSEVVQLLSAYSGKLCLAATNSPQSCTISGDANAVDKLHQHLKTSHNSSNLFIRVLDVPAAYHSHFMDPILGEIQHTIGILKEHEMQAELFSTVTGKMLSKGDFSTGKYWARNIREQVAFEQAVRSSVTEKKNVVFVEIGPRRALQRYIMEILGDDTLVLPSVQPYRDHETMLTVVSRLFELGVQVNWDQFYMGRKAPPTPFPRYQFDKTRKDVFHVETQTTFENSHPVLSPTGQNDKEFICKLSSDSTSYLHEHKNNGVAIIPGAFYVELGFASFLAQAKPKVPLSSVQLSISFQSPHVLNQNSPKIKVQLVAEDTETKFKIYSPSAIYASGKVECKPGTSAEEQSISLNDVYKRCTAIVKAETLYKNLSTGGFQYGSVFKNVEVVYCGEECNEAVSQVKVPGEVLNQLHDYCIHPVVLDYFMQIVSVIGAHKYLSRPGYPSSIGKMTILKPLQEEMVIYVRAADMGPDHVEVCGCFTDKAGHVLVELTHVRTSYLKRASVTDDCFFHNEVSIASEEINDRKKPKALVFADQRGVWKALQQHLHPESIYIPHRDVRELSGNGTSDFLSKFNMPGDRKYEEVLFMWGIQDLHAEESSEVLDYMVSFCELFRQIVLKLREDRFPYLIRTITYESTEKTVDQIRPGFVLSGMARACAAEAEGLSFQLIDIASFSPNDLRALGEVIHSYPCKKYPEVTISSGQIYKTTFAKTTLKIFDSPEKKDLSTASECFKLQTANPYRMTSLSAISSCDTKTQLETQAVEVQVNKICVHSSDYFPVSVSDLNLGPTMYWRKHVSQNHTLLSLDFCGTVTAVGRDVKRLKVGDQIVSCYPTPASSKVTVPEVACYEAKSFPFLTDVPCVSFFVLAWELFHHTLPKETQKGNLAFISSAADSCLLKVLLLAAKKSGWIPTVETRCGRLLENSNNCDVFVLLPPFDESSVTAAASVSSAKHIVVICDNQAPASLSQNILRNANENAAIHTIQMSNVFQKAYLKNQRTMIDRWLTSMHLEKSSLAQESTTFQKMTTRDSEAKSSEESESYFSSKTTSLIVLDGAEKNKMSDIPVLENQTQIFQKNAIYIVTGGLSGLGFETVKFIARRGGGHIVIFSRRPPTPDMQIEMDNQNILHGALVISLQCEISKIDQVLEAFSVIGQRFPSCAVKGVFHSAVVLHDGLLETLDMSLFEKVMKPKIQGALNLHHATKEYKLDYFVCYSSISSCIGNASQTNYGSANSFLDMFCHYRRNRGLAGQSINWGPLNVGLLLDKAEFHTFLASKGLMTMELSDIHECLEKCLRQNDPQQIVCKFNYRTMRNHVLSHNSALATRLHEVVKKGIMSANETDPLNQPQMQSLDNSVSSLQEYVRSVLCELSNVETEKDELILDTALTAFGIDSMLAMTLQNRIFLDRGVKVPLVRILDPNSTLSTLVSVLKESGEAGVPTEDLST
ncbi:highly reducing polyketide synthase SAT13-like [Megalops cyprinoides]|uniref:highly reducing polyketide synthase SAT13-like n=1 Tax=Megalops cyprinoides TaxID=118141 RepID=UPI001865618A|nr:highly reducing polyketide synthase SAT13-like [Megalops cyprinoides]